MKVINCSRTDWANFSSDNAAALRSVGVDAESLCMIKHSFDYVRPSTVCSQETIKQKMREADYVQIMHSCSHSLNAFIASGSKAKLIVYHTGTIYRNDPGTFNNLFNPHVCRSVIALPEFSGLGSKNEQYIVGAVDTDSITPSGRMPTLPYKVAHYPSNAEVKGAEQIIEMMDRLRASHDDKFSFNYSSQIVNMPHQCARVDECDIYIELFKPFLNGKRYGSFGIQALEASAMGKVVITQCIMKSVYEKEYGESALFFPLTQEDFISTVMVLTENTSSENKMLQLHTREWAVKNHSYKATGERLLAKVLI